MVAPQPSFNEVAGYPRGNPRRAQGPDLLAAASMRPRVIPAEICLTRPLRPRPNLASMRPRVIPAEINRQVLHIVVDQSRFNEAAGYPRGNRPARHSCQSSVPCCFNEAAGYPRGNRKKWPNERNHIQCSFNEAAGYPRGNRAPQAASDAPHPCASMRPRVIPAEIGARAARRVCGVPASMRPRVIPAEIGDYDALQEWADWLQ